MAQITPIKNLNPDRVPVTVKATVISLWDSPRPETVREGRLEDETGFAFFTLRADSTIGDLEKNQKYIFHRAGLESVDGRLQVVIDCRTAAYPIAAETDVYRTMLKITRIEETERKRYAKGAKISPSGRPAHSRRNLFSIAITAGLFLWVAVMFLHYTEPGRVVSGQVSDFFRRRMAAAREKAARKSERETHQGTVEKTLAGGSFTVRVGSEPWTISYLGIELPRRAEREGAIIDPVALRADHFIRFRIGGKTVRMEFEAGRGPVNGTGKAYVFEGGRMVNLELLERGLARLKDAGRGLAYGRELRAAEKSARVAKKGVWRE